MIFVLAILAIFVAVSVYFYFRAETLQRKLVEIKKETSSTKKENQLLADAIALIAKKNEEFIQFRLATLKERCQEGEVLILYLTPLAKNYAAIVRESLKGKGQTNKIIKKCFDAYDPTSFQKLSSFISKQGGHYKRMWNSNNLNGFMSLVEALLNEAEKEANQTANKETS
ncbi:hypothetical protein [Thalassotalea ganghwensis]